jgi:tRNA wybutosine-synthesizing protein 4
MGSDPLPFQFLSREKSLCTNTIFIDIDYEKLMLNKKNVILDSKEIMDILEDAEFLSDENALLVRSKHYIGVGCDLRDLRKLGEVLQSEVSFTYSSVLCVAEVSLTYMDVDSANAVIAWGSKLSHGQLISSILPTHGDFRKLIHQQMLDFVSWNNSFQMDQTIPLLRL